MKKWQGTLIIVVVITAILSFFAYELISLVGQSTFTETFYQVQSDKVDQNIRTVFLSDLHLNKFGEGNSQLIERVAELKPDFISIGGDMNMYGNSDYSMVTDLVSKLCEIAPVYYGLGNHELQEMVLNKSDIDKDIAAAGAVVLNDKSKEIEVKGNKIVIGALSESGGAVEKYSGNFLEEFPAKSGFKLLLSHYPSNFDTYLKDKDIDLVLSGHEHGNVVIIPNVYEPYTEGHHIRYHGDFNDGKPEMIVSRGLGISSWLPRFNNTPEVVVIDINWH